MTSLAAIVDGANWLGRYSLFTKPTASTSDNARTGEPRQVESGPVYRADVDGLRAVAVLSVLFYHLGATFVPGGFVGVDVFFVISGFVITARINADVAQGRFSILDFYERRIRRIIPALAVTLFVTTAIFGFIMSWANLADLSKSLIAAAFSVSNIFFWKTTGYFDPSAEIRPLLHTWSLAVEEQFYLLFPLFFIAIARYKSYFNVKYILTFFALASFILSVVMTRISPSGNFFLLPTRAWELLVGSVLAVRTQAPAGPIWVRQGLGALGALLIGVALVAYGTTTPFPGLAASLPVIGAALIIATGEKGDTLPAVALSTRPMVGVGAISYSLYLVHWPVITFARYWLLSDPGPFTDVVVVLVSFLLAWLSWRYVERPFRRPPKRWRRYALFSGAAATLAAMAAAGVLVFQLSAPRSAATESALEEDYSKYGVCFLVNAPPSAWEAQQCQRTTGASRNALLWGDSFAAHYMAGILHDADRFQSNIFQYTSAGCPPMLGFASYAVPHCHDFNQAVFDVIKRMNIQTVILSGRWDLYRDRLDSLGETLERLKALGLEVYVLGLSPVFSFDPQYLAARNAGTAPNGEANWVSKIDMSLNARLQEIAAGAKFIDPLNDWCKGDKCAYMRGGALMFSDYGHFSKQGSIFAVEHYFPLLNRNEAANKRAQ
jgi:peptidoglycan/LPS O-acetylase OafA/YrhL